MNTSKRFIWGKEVDPTKTKDNIYECPHCEEPLDHIDVQDNHCYKCGGRLMWNDIATYNEIMNITCKYLGENDKCNYCIGNYCNNTNECDFAINDNTLKNYLGYISPIEKRRFIYNEEWKTNKTNK